MNGALPFFTSISDLERLLREVHALAQLAWAPERLRQAIDPLIPQPASDDAVDSAARDFLQISMELISALGSAEIQFTVVVKESQLLFRDRANELTRYLGDRSTADAAEWATRALEKLQNLVHAVLSIIPPAAFGQGFVVVAEELASHGGPLSGPGTSALKLQVLLVALFEAMDRGISPSQLDDLAERAYFEAASMIDELAAQGAPIDVLGATEDERRAFALNILKHADGALDSSAWTEIAASRISQFR